MQEWKDESRVWTSFSGLAEYVLVFGAYKATKYLDEKLTVKATRKRFKGKIDKRSKIVEIIFTVGRPNYEERDFIKKAKKAGEPFPIKKIQAKYLKA